MSWYPRPEDPVFSRLLCIEWFTGFGAGICAGAAGVFLVVAAFGFLA